eukprot:m.172992 g.172992  ORF g.172992 m.172992 type:complete len:749 (+) comp39087_c0_seq57:392-2638(+)
MSCDRQTKKVLENVFILLLLAQQAAGKAVRSVASETEGEVTTCEKFWNKWSEWTSCSSSCGGGVSKRSRECSVGEACSGESEVTCTPGDGTQYRSCNRQKCNNSRDLRKEQCLLFNHIFPDNPLDWIPYYNRSLNPCALSCHDTSRNTFSVLRPTVLDGTRCYEDPLEPGVCADGKCLEAGCDGVIVQEGKPPEKYDVCGVCGGSNNSCKVVAGDTVAEQIGVELVKAIVYYRLLELPTGARNINVTQRKLKKPVKGFLALVNGKGSFYVNGPDESNNTVSLDVSKSFLAAGTIFNYTSSRDKDGKGEDSLHALGVIQEPLIVLALFFGRAKFDISFSYALPGHQNQSTYNKSSTIPKVEVTLTLGTESADYDRMIKPGKEHKEQQVDKGFPLTATVSPNEADQAEWIRGGFGRCSVSCGGGMKVAQYECVLKKRHVDAIACLRKEMPAVRPEAEEKKCNIHPCPAKWKTRKYSRCSRTCGKGFQKRTIECQQNVDGLTVIVSPKLCPAKKPSSRRRCDKPSCKGTWTPTSPFGECSSSCGSGVRRRSVVCTGAAFCDPDKKQPISEEKCCNASGCTKMVWYVNPWIVSVTCGEGVRRRRTFCHGTRDDGSTSCELPEEMCNPDTKPNTMENLTLFECPKIAADWLVTPWTKCPETCQSPSGSTNSVRSRVVLCMKGFFSASSSECTKDKPASFEECPSQPACPPVDNQNCRDREEEYDCKLVCELALCKYRIYKTNCCASCVTDGCK